MKKIVSVILCLAVVFGCFTGIISVSAATSSDSTYITFDEAWATNPIQGGGVALVADPDTASGHGNVAKYSKISYYGAGTAANGGRWKQTFKFLDPQGGTVHLTQGVKYVLSYDIKVGTIKSTFSPYLFYLNESNSVANITFTYDGNSTYLDSMTQTSTDWVHKEYEITALKDGIPALAFLKSAKTDSTGNEIYVDNIRIEPKNCSYTSVTFDESLIESGGATVVDDPDTTSDHGKVIQYVKISKTGTTTSSNDTKWMNAYRIVDADGTAPFEIKPNTTYKLTYDIKKTNATAEFNVTVLQALEGVGLDSVNTANYFTWDDNNRILKQNWEGKATGDSWATGSCEFTTKAADLGTNLIFGITASAKTAEQEIYFDNIKVQEVVEIPVYNVEGTTSVSTLCGEGYESITAPKVNGYKFNGWYFDAEFTKPATGSILSNADIYAMYVEKAPYTTVTFDESLIESSGATVVADPDAASDHGKVIQYVKISKAGTTTSSNDTKWMNAYRIVDADGTAPFEIKPNTTYKLTYDIKKTNATAEFNVTVLQALEGVGLGDVNTANYFTWDDNNRIIAQNYEDKATEGSWATGSCEFTTKAADLGTNLIFGITASAKTSNQEIYFDNIKVQEVIEIPVYNVDGATTVKGAYGDSYESIGLVKKDGMSFGGWYFDDAFATPATGTIVAANALYAKYTEKIPYTEITFDEHLIDHSTSTPIVSDPDTTSGHGNVISYSKISKKSTDSASSDGKWMNAYRFSDSEGYELFEVKANTKYKFTYDIKKTNATVNFNVTLLQAVADAGIENIHSHNYYTTDSESRFLVDSWESFASGAGWETNSVEFTTKDAEKGTNLIVTLSASAKTADQEIYFDNFKLQEAVEVSVNDADGALITNTDGFYGDTFSFKDFDTEGETNIVSVESDNIVLKNDVIVNGAVSQIAVTAATADAAAKKLNLRVNYTGLGIAQENGGVKVTDVTIGNVKYNVSEIGLLAIPTASLNGAALTLETEGALKLSGADFHYSSAADGKVTAYADVNVADIATEYTVVGFIKTNAKTIYSVTRNSITTSVAATAGLEVDTDVVTAVQYDGMTYNLDWNSEFSDSSAVENKFKLKNNTADYVIEDGLFKSTSVATSATESTNVYVQSKYNMTTGYMEVRAKYSDHQLADGSLWLNAAGIRNGLIHDVEKSPEIDIIEYNGLANQTTATLHMWKWEDGTHCYQENLDDDEASGVWADFKPNEWHTYGFLRTANKMVIYVDGVEKVVINKTDDLKHIGWSNGYVLNDTELAALFENPAYLIFSSAFIGLEGQEAGQEAESCIDYVRFYK